MISPAPTPEEIVNATKYVEETYRHCDSLMPPYIHIAIDQQIQINRLAKALDAAQRAIACLPFR